MLEGWVARHAPEASPDLVAYVLLAARDADVGDLGDVIDVAEGILRRVQAGLRALHGREVVVYVEHHHERLSPVKDDLIERARDLIAKNRPDYYCDDPLCDVAEELIARLETAWEYCFRATPERTEP